MTRKDYKLIAGVLRDSCWVFDDARYEFMQNIVDDFCVALQAENPNFKKHKFEEAVFGKRTYSKAFEEERARVKALRKNSKPMGGW